MTSNDLIPPELLLCIPTPSVPSEYFDTGKLILTVEQAEKLRDTYFQDVAFYIESNAVDTDRELVPAVEWGLRLYNAENFTGELCPSEREHLRAVYERFGAAALLPLLPPLASSTEGGANGDADEGHAKGPPSVNEALLHETFLQRLLTSDGEMPIPCTRMSGLLLCLIAIITSNVNGNGASPRPRFPYTSPWRLRTHFRHQLCLQRRAHHVFLELSACVDAILSQPEETITVEALLEVGHVQSYYHRRELAADTFQRAAKRSGLMLEEEAIMGVRTRWQRHQLVQAVLNATSSRPVPQDSTTEEQPHTVMPEAEGHDLLDRPRGMPESEPLPVVALHPEDKAILLAFCMDAQSWGPSHDLARHRTQLFVERLIVDPSPSPFVVRCQTLLERARLEVHRNRVRERAFMQFSELVDQCTARRDPNHANFARTNSSYFYSVAYPSMWSLKTEYADLCFEENLYKTALDIYEQVLDWEKIIECCKKLDKRRRVESLVRELLEKDPQNPVLWVALGEATRDDAHLWKAWELSQHKMASPMRALARLALERKNYEDVVRYFDEAVRINPVFGGDWFTLGYASLKLRLWGRSGEAFTRVCQIDPEDAFAWNNLASIMLRENKPRLAFNAMSQALRNNRRDWRMWLNYFHIGTQLKEVLETTNALGIVLEIGKRSVSLDSDVMDMFVDNTIAYLKGDIPGAPAEIAGEGEEMQPDAVRFKSITNTSMTSIQADIAHVPIRVDDFTVDGSSGELAGEGDAAACASLLPLGLDSEDMEAWKWSSAKGLQDEDNAVVQAEIRKRHEKRVRDLFARLLDNFVSDPDLYSCTARLFRYLDGPSAAHHYRVKELRACRQKDQWERSDKLFQRTVRCLEGMVDDVVAMVEVKSEAPQASVTREPATDPERVESGDSVDHRVFVTAESPIDDMALRPIRQDSSGVSEGEASSRKSAIHALEETLQNIRAVLSSTEEYMESTEGYARLRGLAGRVRAVLEAVKSPTL
ncbi:unnamed protein product [Phytomonas sp. EM1]|nr:unnamed protein product [Phytomonas sp. EM1]|eukprot:CCW65695.1 unnamed protein product [Phytomonas sp. isolate EM1]